MATQGVNTWSTTAVTNGTIDPAISMAEGVAPSALNDGVRGLMTSVARWRDDLYGLTTGGSATAYTVTTNSTFVSAAAMSGAIFTIIPHATSGASPTLAVDGLTARALNVSTGVGVNNAALIAGTPYHVKYVHASTEFIVLGLTTIPAGVVNSYAGSSAPTGWLLCNGASVLRTDYPALFTAIGTTHGSADGTHFTLPDATGRTIAGKESSASRLTSAVSGVDGGTLGATGGSQSHTLTIAQLASHNHGGATGTQSQNHTHGLGGDLLISAGVGTNISGAIGLIASIGGTSNTSGTDSVTHTHTIPAQGSDTAHNNVQPTIVLNFIIKT